MRIASRWSRSATLNRRSKMLWPDCRPENFAGAQPRGRECSEQQSEDAHGPAGDRTANHLPLRLKNHFLSWCALSERCHRMTNLLVSAANVPAHGCISRRDARLCSVQVQLMLHSTHASPRVQAYLSLLACTSRLKVDAIGK